VFTPQSDGAVNEKRDDKGVEVETQKVFVHREVARSWDNGIGCCSPNSTKEYVQVGELSTSGKGGG